MAATEREIVLDTSVLVKWYAGGEEPHRREALALLDRFVGGKLEIHCPELVLYEMGNVLGKRAHDPEGAFRSFLDLPLKIHRPGPGMLLRALAIMAHKGGSFYDTIFVALSDDLGIPLVTADRQQARRSGGKTLLLEAFIGRA
jgi:predicted nucleic acid-binding protein